MDDIIIRQMMVNEISQKLDAFQKEHPEIRISYIIGILEELKKNIYGVTERDPEYIKDFLKEIYDRLNFYSNEHKISKIEINGIITTLQFNYIIIMDGLNRMRNENQKTESKKEKNK